jgi:hypothetical protein
MMQQSSSPALSSSWRLSSPSLLHMRRLLLAAAAVLLATTVVVVQASHEPDALFTPSCMLERASLYTGDSDFDVINGVTIDVFATLNAANTDLNQAAGTVNFTNTRDGGLGSKQRTGAFSSSSNGTARILNYGYARFRYTVPPYTIAAEYDEVRLLVAIRTGSAGTLAFLVSHDNGGRAEVQIVVNMNTGGPSNASSLITVDNCDTGSTAACELVLGIDWTPPAGEPTARGTATTPPQKHIAAAAAACDAVVLLIL